ncbi:NADH:flavin oxidoreductase [Arthrobacter sp. ERGS1:01]|uniref:oxidoreductase n=1 Tax=Arthrobacter sp. ERGS1:01 TaxID=1704044 RepID=UPI0006B5FDB4|nr:NADH:flavin oxidoreductase [Arthrobacter sp. ERGS1:01]ALE06208.1 NADH:flavin oxidoreductase [Arthrobacter sp. ERGS1:01]
MTYLSDPLDLRHGHPLPNRLVLAPMTNQQSNPDGTLSDDELAWLVARAEGGFGLLQTAAAYVHPAGQVWPGQLSISSDEHLPGLERLAAAVSAAGARSSVQLHHGGVRAEKALSGQEVMGPWDDAQTGVRGMTTGEVQQAVEDFAEAAARAEKAGIDGIEVHGGHGYLVGQFLDASNNLRADGYGTDPTGRARFVKEVVHAVRERTGPGFHIGLRLSVERYGLVLTDMVQLVGELFASGDIDILDLSLWDVAKPPTNAPEGGRTLLEHFLDLPRHGTALGVAGHLTSAAAVKRVLDQGADLAYIGKAAIADHAFSLRAIADPGYRAPSFPVTRDHLRSEKLADPFVSYFATNWPQLVQD